jgi:predicted amidophosphoribosyltransferase
LSLFGPACGGCGKPLRTPRATLCAECGAEVQRS